jgi:hypothetical protein
MAEKILARCTYTVHFYQNTLRNRFSGAPAMGLAREEITNLALRYIAAEEIGDFPFEGDLFCLLIRQLPADRVLPEAEGWAFNGYGICTGYAYDDDVKPHGKWLWMHFASLAAFPPVAQVLKLQPPQVVKGRFHSADRTHEIRIVKVAFGGDKTVSPIKDTQVQPGKKEKSEEPAPRSGKAANIVAFRTKKPS